MQDEQRSMAKIKVAIGFVTGRDSFKKVLNAHIFHWAESDVVDKENISLNLFVAYDLKYSGTKPDDYTDIRPRSTRTDRRDIFYRWGHRITRDRLTRK